MQKAHLHTITNLRALKPLLLLLILLILGGFSTDMLGNECKVIVGVGSGKGKAKAELWKHPITGHSKVTETGYVKNGDGTTEKTGDIYRSTNAYGKYIAEAATGYSFSGWHSEATCSNNASGTTATWSTGEIAAKNNPVFKYYAKFTPNQYDVTLNPNGGSGNNQTIQATYDAAMPSKIKNSNNSITAPSREGYIFAGYYDTDAATGGKKYYNADLTSANNWDKTSATILYARWTANTYTVAFNGNGSTGGSMSNESFTFDTAKSLTSNAYIRIYTVSYDADGGSTASTTDANTKATYTFNGWEDRNSIKYNGTTYTYATFDAPYYANTYNDLYNAFGYNKYSLVKHYVVYGNGEGRSCKGATPGLYPNGASVANLTTEVNGTVTLYANWTSGSVTLPTATRENHVIEGWYNGSVDNPENKVGVPGDSYTPTENTTLTAKWIEQYPFTMSGEDRTMNVGDEISPAFTFTYADHPTVHIDITSISSVKNGNDVIEYDAEHNKLIARNAGVATIYFTQENTETILPGTSDTWTITVNKLNNTLTVASESYSGKYVDDVISEIVSNVNSDANVTTSSSVEGLSNDEARKIAYYNVSDNKIYMPNKDAASFTSKTITINIAQEETYKYKPISKDITLTVNKYQTSFTGSAYNLMVDGIQSEAYSYTNTSAATPTNDSNDNFYYTIDDIKFDSVALNKGENFVTYNPTGSQITACNAGTGKITFHQKETYKYTGAETSFDVTVSKHDPLFEWDGDKEVNYTFNYPHNTTKANIFTTNNSTTAYTIVSDNEYSANVQGVGSTNTLEVYNVAEDAHITITQEENYRWKGQTKEYTIHPTNPNNHVPFAMTNENVAAIQKKVSNNVVWNGSDNYYKLGDGTWVGTRPDESVKIGFTGIPDKLYFSINAEKAGVQVGLVVFKYYPAKSDYEFYVYESATGNDDDWHQLDWGFSNSEGFESSYLGSNDSKRHIQVALSATTRFVKFRYKGSCWGRFENIHVTELNKFVADKETIDFGTQGEKYGTQMETVNFSHANAGRTTTVRLEGTDAAYFTYTPTEIPGTGRDLSGMTTCRVAFNNNGVSRNTEYQAELVFADNLGHEERVPLRGFRFGKCVPEYTWNPNHLPYYFNSTIAHVAVSSNTDYEHCQMTYETTDAAIAYVDAAGNLQIGEKSGTVTITVKQEAGNNDYKPGSATFTFTPRERPSLATPFQVTSSVYNDVEAGDWCYWENSEGGRVRSGGCMGDLNIYIDDWIWENDKKVFTIAFSEAPDSLSFEYRNDERIYINSTKPSNYHMWEVQESSDGATWNTVWYADSQEKSWKKVKGLALNASTQYLKFVFWGNYAGYWRNINVTSFDGYKFLREEENDQYLSRGANFGTRAVVDAFGIATRVTRSTTDNENYYAKFQFVDNEQFLFENTSNQIYTDNGNRTATNWKVTIDHDLWKIQSANGLGKEEYYITITDGNLALTNNPANATQWYLENYLQHTSNITTMLDAQAAAAADHSDLDFPADVRTLAAVRNELSERGYEFTDIDIPSINVTNQTWSTDVRNNGAVANAVYANEISGLIPGFYHLSVKAFDRIASANVAYDVFDRELQSIVAYVYANDVKYPIKSIFDETGRQGVQFTEGTGLQYPNGYYYANDLTAAGVAFDNENGYVNDVYVYIPADDGETTGTLRYGIMSPSYVEGAWMVYGNISLRHLDRAQYIFDGKDTEDKENWQENENWDRGDKPNEDNAVIIRSDVTIEEEVSVYSVTIENNAKVTIAPTGGLTVGKGGIKGKNLDETNIVLKAGTQDEVKGQTGFLRIDPDCEFEMPQATVEMLRQGYSSGYSQDNFGATGYMTWQYIGCPINYGEKKKIKDVVGGWMNSWDEENGTWVNDKFSAEFKPFIGFANSQNVSANGALTKYKGQLFDNDTYDISLTCHGESKLPGWNLLANSFAAPIDIKSMFDDNSIDNVEHAVYLFNTGNTDHVAGKAGTYTPITKALAGTKEAEVVYQGVIPSMQGFFVKAKRPCQFTINYKNVVWDAVYTGESKSIPMRTPKHSAVSEKQVVSILLEANGQRDKVLLVEKADYSTEFENGYDAHIMPVGNFNIFTVEGEDDYLAIDATNSIIGTRVGVRTGDETTYTMKFNYLRSEDELALLDTETNTTTDIDEGTEYTFYAAPNSEILGRFQIVERAVAPSTPTGIEGAESEVKVHKFIKDNQLYILKNGVLYNGMGAVVR